jgi:hypothetical protein
MAMSSSPRGSAGCATTSRCPGSVAEREWEGRLRRVTDGVQRTTSSLTSWRSTCRSWRPTTVSLAPPASPGATESWEIEGR